MSETVNTTIAMPQTLHDKMLALLDRVNEMADKAEYLDNLQRKASEEDAEARKSDAENVTAAREQHLKNQAENLRLQTEAQEQTRRQTIALESIAAALTSIAAGVA